MDYFYSQQIRQYRLQVIRAFSNFSVSFGKNSDGTENLRRVPCRYGDTSRIAETIIAGGSENKMPSAPFISVYVTSMALAPERRHSPALVSTVNVNERAYDESTQTYLNTPGNRYSVQRFMPVPYNLNFNVDFWTSNLDQKEQLIEHVLCLFNGMIDLQTSNNGLDWSNLTTLEPTNITWSSRSIPIGTENPIDVFTVEYKVPIWISPPAKVQHQRIIQQIVTNIQDGTYDPVTMEWTTESLLTRNITSPDEARIQVRLVGENLYELGLQTHAGVSADERLLPTRVIGSAPPRLVPGSAFRLNGYSITIPNTSIDDLLSVIRMQTQDTEINIRLNLSGLLEIYNNAGGDIVLENVQGTPVNQLGFVETTYRGGTLAWWRLLEQYGTLRNYSTDKTGASQILLLTSSDLDDRRADVRGWLQAHPTNQNLLQWIPDMSTWPRATLPAVTAVIDPHRSFPGTGLSEPAPGQRYLLIDDISVTSEAWGSVHAQVNDIIEWNGAEWVRSFDSEESVESGVVQLVQNRFSQKWLRFAQGEWTVFPDDHYLPGSWRISL